MTTSPDEPDERADSNRDPADPQATDEAFAAIIARLQQPTPPADATWPAIEDDTPPPADADNERLGSQWDGWEDIATHDTDTSDEDVEDVDEDYVPPPPPPLPKGDPVLRWAWIGAVGAPVLALALSFLDWDFDGLVGFALIAAFFAGFATLIARMRTGPGDEDTPDDGAVI